ncbi:MAG TPA: 3-dehydroquinate synthase [Gemmatirosa sp.]
MTTGATATAMSGVPGAPGFADAAAGLLPYRVLVAPGALGALRPLLDAVDADRWVVIADATVARHHAAAVLAQLDAGRPRPSLLLTVPPGEAQKTRERWAALTDAMLAAGCARDTAVLALGGGVVGDLAGFVAATYMRGVPIVQVPTTLLAMVDASVGGKVAVDTPAGKNLVGAFHPPALVVIDPAALATLPSVDLRAGAVEALKHGVIASAPHFDDAARLLAAASRDRAAAPLDDPSLAALVAASVAIKARVVADDPRERGPRHVLNFGHTVGHALERLSGYALRHGEAVAIGMVVEATAAESAGIAAAGTAARIRDALAAGALPVAPPAELDADVVLEAARLDKKTRRGAIEYALPTRIGAMAAGDGRWTVPLPDALVRQAFEACRA